MADQKSQYCISYKHWRNTHSWNHCYFVTYRLQQLAMSFPLELSIPLNMLYLCHLSPSDMLCFSPAFFVMSKVQQMVTHQPNLCWFLFLHINFYWNVVIPFISALGSGGGELFCATTTDFSSYNRKNCVVWKYYLLSDPLWKTLPTPALVSKLQEYKKFASLFTVIFQALEQCLDHGGFKLNIRQMHK